MIQGELPPLGLGEAEERAYQALLLERACRVEELACLLGLPTARVHTALDRLVEHGFARPADPAEEGGLPHPAAPETALRTLIHRRQAELQRRSAELARLRRTADRLAASGRTPPGAPGVETVTGRRAIGERLASLLATAGHEVLVMADRPENPAPSPGDPVTGGVAEGGEAPWGPGPEAPAAAGPLAGPAGGGPARFAVTPAALAARGVALRAVLTRAALDGGPEPGHPATGGAVGHGPGGLGAWVGRGAGVRVAERVPTRLVVVDRRVALLPPVDPAAPGAYALVVAEARLRDALLPLFEAAWTGAAPLEDGGRGAGEVVGAGEQRELLALLAAGLKDEAIARRLGVHVHTARRRISRLLEALDARTRFQAGARATARGWLRP
ncbi:hypothetical protein I3F58_01355 [Streptomyces sp. MUM 203J]|uniref:helix-turn-helix domain-containing protein n=1 Tax=Streptomyces sp. MUM 203J TaxID=2791990 RepID=UPI0023D95FA0|nr:helix-turn-helix domain-containing protein [Streptomyces sp. MUM 203J]MCH0538227.1 hypothetical protein [Streptomyces sp. MUM 203J]